MKIDLFLVEISPFSQLQFKPFPRLGTFVFGVLAEFGALLGPGAIKTALIEYENLFIRIQHFFFSDISSVVWSMF